jgi:predicted DCC family thiol-disulfide oxidoreductase YuxK
MQDYIEKTIVIYDGECNFCDASVNFLLRMESFEFCYFTHLNSSIGKRILADFEVPESFDGLLFLENQMLFGKSEAALRISRYLKFPFPLISFFFWIPVRWRDGIYDYIAKRRYKWWGKKECPMPSDPVLKRFLD